MMTILTDARKTKHARSDNHHVKLRTGRRRTVEECGVGSERKKYKQEVLQCFPKTLLKMFMQMMSLSVASEHLPAVVSFRFELLEWLMAPLKLLFRKFII